MFSTVQRVTYGLRQRMSKPQPPPEAVLIRLAREAAHTRTADAAREAGVSKARWSQIESGYESRQGTYEPVVARAVTLAHMAHAVGLTPARLEGAGRPDAAAVLAEILRRDEPHVEQDAEPFLRPDDPPSFRRIMADPDPALTEQEKRGLVIWGRELIRRRAEERAEAERRGA
jgi:transcriptional regulator with XRE-family HTH domain